MDKIEAFLFRHRLIMLCIGKSWSQAEINYLSGSNTSRALIQY